MGNWDRVYIGVGSNVGDRLNSIIKGLNILNSKQLFRIIKLSRIYESKPYGIEDQDNFLNMVVLAETKLSPEALLKFLKETETQVGRVNRGRWKERELDLDILLYGQEIIEREELIVPHKELLLRDFVIIPLLDLDENIIHPLFKKKISELWDNSLNNHILEVCFFQLFIKNGKIKKVEFRD